MSPTWSVSCRRHGADMSACLSFCGEKIPDTTPTLLCIPKKVIKTELGMQNFLPPEITLISILCQPQHAFLGEIGNIWHCCRHSQLSCARQRICCYHQQQLQLGCCHGKLLQAWCCWSSKPTMLLNMTEFLLPDSFIGLRTLLVYVHVYLD